MNEKFDKEILQLVVRIRNFFAHYEYLSFLENWIISKI